MITIKKILTDMIPVLFGVLIALFINDWKQNADSERFLRTVMSAVDQEMEINKSEFEFTIKKQYALVDTIQHYMKNDTISLTELFSKSKGLQIPSVRNTAWKSFQNSRLELVEFSTISILTDIDESKQFLIVKTNQLMEFVLNNAESTSAADKRVFMIQLLNLIDTEENLLEYYNKYLGVEIEEEEGKTKTN